MNEETSIHSGSVRLKTPINNIEQSDEELILLFNKFFTTQKNINFSNEIILLPKNNQKIITTSLHFTNIKATNTGETVDQIKHILQLWHLTLLKSYPTLEIEVTFFTAI